MKITKPINPNTTYNELKLFHELTKIDIEINNGKATAILFEVYEKW